MVALAKPRPWKGACRAKAMAMGLKGSGHGPMYSRADALSFPPQKESAMSPACRITELHRNSPNIPK